MRAREFINETRGDGEIHPHHASVSQGVFRMRDVGGYDRTYHLNRIWMATAMADGKTKAPVDMDSASWAEKYNVAVPYTDEEHLMILAAMATIPTDGKELQKRSKSKEPDDTNKLSPVPDWNPNSREKKKVKESASSGGTSSGSIASNPAAGGKPANQVGSLFGGTYGESEGTPKKKKTKLVRRQ